MQCRFLFALAFLLMNSAHGAGTLFVAPEATGDGSGDTAASAADWRDQAFWDTINPALRDGPVTITFAAGTYVVSSDSDKKMPALTLKGLGHETNKLTFQGAEAGKVIFTRHSDDSLEGDGGPGFFFMSNCQNAVVRNLTFTAPHVPIGYATNFGGSRNILIENCHWHDLQGVYYGATGASRSGTDHVTFRNCRFERVGSGGHAHMAYNAYDVRHIRFIDCTFEDCAGDYIRFRDKTEFGVVTGCTFRSTGEYTNTHMPFVSMPLFNDDDPASEKASKNYEYFGTNFLIFNNKFIYETEEKAATRIAIVFHQSGYSPPGVNLLLSAEEANELRNSKTARKKTFLKKHLGIDANTIHVYGNDYKNIEHKGVYRFAAQYGAKSRGGDGIFDISDTFNTTPVVRAADEALTFFK